MSDSFATPWTACFQVSLFTGFTARIPRSVAICFLEDLPNTAIESSLFHCRLISLLLSHLGDSYFSLYNVLPEADFAKVWWLLQNHHLHLLQTLAGWNYLIFSRTHSIEYKSCPRKSCYTSWNFFFWYFNSWVYTLDVHIWNPCVNCPHANGRTALDSQCSKFEDQVEIEEIETCAKRWWICGLCKVFCHDRVVSYLIFMLRAF